VNLQGTGCESVNWSNVEQDMIQWWAAVTTAMKLRVSRNAGNFLFECFGSLIDC
jgi:hypothetical protein